jgi:hypothetical protein
MAGEKVSGQTRQIVRHYNCLHQSLKTAFCRRSAATSVYSRVLAPPARPFGSFTDRCLENAKEFTQL